MYGTARGAKSIFCIAHCFENAQIAHFHALIVGEIFEVNWKKLLHGDEEFVIINSVYDFSDSFLRRSQTSNTAAAAVKTAN